MIYLDCYCRSSNSSQLRVGDDVKDKAGLLLFVVILAAGSSVNPDTFRSVAF